MSMDSVFEQEVLPNALEIEAALLSSLFQNNNGIDQVSDILEPKHFYSELNGEIYAEILRLIGLGKQAIPPTMAGRFDANDLADIAGNFFGTISNKDYARTIKAAYDRRRIIEIADQMRDGAINQSVTDDVDAIREHAETELFALAATGTMTKPVTVGDAAAETISQISERMEAAKDGRITGVATGLTDIDRSLGGFQPSDLIILAGRPSMGKTAIALSMAYYAANDTSSGMEDSEGAVLVFSLEMSKHQLVERLFANVADVSYSDIVQGNIDHGTFERLNEYADQMRFYKMVIDDRPGATVSRVRSEARRVSRKVGLKMIVVDYLGLMKSSEATNERHDLKIAQITAGLKALAKEMNIPVVLLSQLSRQVEQREDKRPMLSDLRDSGAIEQDADVVMFVYREQYYLERSEPSRRNDEAQDKFADRYARWQDRLNEVQGTAEVIIGKARRGKVGTIRCAFNGDRQRFSNLYR